MGEIIAYTLCFNLFSEVQKATERLYKQNEGTKFRHIIADLGFPLIQGDVIPENIEDAKEKNSESLKSLAHRFGSEYVKFANIGVSQNTNQVLNYIQPKDDDALISCEPDEVQNEDGWVQAMADVLTELAYCAPHLIEHKELLATSPHAKLETINGRKVYVMEGNLNYGQVGYNCGWLNKIGGIAYPSTMTIYGGIEVCLMQDAKAQGKKWGILKDFSTTHTDYEKGTPNTSRLLREWKNYSVFSGKPQIQLEDWLKQQPKMYVVK